MAPKMRHLLFAAVLVASSLVGTGRTFADSAAKPAPPVDVAQSSGHDFTSEAKALLKIGACGDGALPEGFPKELADKHCDVITKAQTDYTDSWVKPARAFFE